MQSKLHKLEQMGKLSLSHDLRRKGEQVRKDVLDLGKGFFSVDCKKVSGTSYVAYLMIID